MITSARRGVVGAALLALLVALPAMLVPSPAQAGTATLQRSFQNLLFFPFDMVLTPVVSTKALVTNLRDSDDTLPVKIVYPIPGWVFLTGVQLGASLIRGLTGVIELVPGIILLPFDAELDPLYDLPEDKEALVDWEGPINVRFGVDYVSPGSF